MEKEDFILRGIGHRRVRGDDIMQCSQCLAVFSTNKLPRLTRVGSMLKVRTLGIHDAKMCMLGSEEIARVNQLQQMQKLKRVQD